MIFRNGNSDDLESPIQTQIKVKSVIMVFVNSGTIQELLTLNQRGNFKVLVKPEDIQNRDQKSIYRFIPLSLSVKLRARGQKGVELTSI